MRGVKTPTIRAAFLLAVLAACSRDEAPHAPESNRSSPARVEVGAARAKPEMLPVEKRRVLELEGGVRVEVLAEGQGSIVGPGDEVALSMTLSYVPTVQPPAAEAAPIEPVEDAQAEKPKPKSKSKRNADKKSGEGETAKVDAASDAKPVEVAEAPAEGSVTPDATTDGEKKTDEKSKGDGAKADADVAKAETGTGKTGDAATTTDNAGNDASGAEKSEVARSESADVDPAHAKSGDAATDASQTGDDAANARKTVTATDANAPTTAPDGSAMTPASDAKDASAPSVGDSQAAPAADASTPVATTPAPDPLAAPLEPVIVLSTKTLGMPIRGRVGADGALLPALSRALIGLRAGTVAEIMLPPEAAYGAAGLPSAGIPPGTLLLAHIEIREVRR